MKNKLIAGFSILEVLMGVIVMVVIVGVAIPAYDKAIQRAVERDVIIRLNGIIAAVRAYKGKNGDYPAAMDGIDSINAMLGTNLADTDKVAFTCENRWTTEFECAATATYGWVIHAQDFHLDGAPHCWTNWEGATHCPTCVEEGCP